MSPQNRCSNMEEPEVVMRRDQRAYNAAYYARHRDREIERVTRRQRAARDWLRDLRRVPCMDCGRSFEPHVMDFDDRDRSTKRFNVAGRSFLRKHATVMAEVAKCDIVCANCHRIRTFANSALGPPVRSRLPLTSERERSRRRFRDAWQLQAGLLRAFRSAPCADCAKTFPWHVMEFDHRQPEQKVALVTRMAGRASLARLLEEVAKCDIVCANCHRMRTLARRSKTGRSAGVL